MNPYLIQGPAKVSFSGGRSSAYLLCKIVEAHGGVLPDDVPVLFANTGKAREETLVFIDRVSRHLGVAVHWVEYEAFDGPQKDRWREVTYETAKRNGEPFRELVISHGYMPNPVARICTQHLKIKPMEGYMRHRFGLKVGEYAEATGIRADEPGRVARGRARQDVDLRFPLADAGVAAADVVAFWKAMPFDLGLPSIGGATMHGNCDLCYLKGPRKLLSLIRESPERADWWASLEAETGTLFRNDRPNYAAMKIIAMRPQLFDDLPAEDAMPCECTD